MAALHPIRSSFAVLPFAWALSLGHLQQQGLGLPKDDVRLDRLISIQACGESIESILRRVSDAPQLSATRNCAELKLQCRVTAKPLRSFLGALAEIVPGHWERVSGGAELRLVADSDYIKKRGTWWTFYLEERERAIQRQRDRVLGQIQKAAETVRSDPAANPPEPDLANARVFATLPVDLLSRIAWAYQGRGFLALQMAGETAASSSQNLVVVPWNVIPLEAQRAVQSAQKSPQDSLLALAFLNSGVSVSIRELASDGTWRSVGTPINVGFDASLRIAAPSHEWLPPYVAAHPNEVSENWKKLSSFAGEVFWKRDLPGPKPAGRPRRAEILLRISEKTKEDFIADFHSQPCEPLTITERLADPIYPIETELDFRAKQLDFSWRRSSSGVILVRNNRWYRDDVLEVPQKRILAILKEWDHLLADAKEGLPDRPLLSDAQLLRRMVELRSEIVQDLSEIQIANGLANYVNGEIAGPFDPSHPKYTWRPLALIAAITLEEYALSQFYGSLSRQQQEDIVERGIAISSLSPHSKSLALSILPELQVATEYQMLHLALKLAEEKQRPFMMAGRNPSPGLVMPLCARLAVMHLD